MRSTGKSSAVLIDPERGAALVTGAGKRIGKALALALAGAGYRVLVHYRGKSDDADEVVQAIKAAGGRGASIEANLADRASAASLIARAAEPFGALSLLVNSASYFHDDDVQTFTAESWDTHFQTNLHSPLLLAQGFAAQAQTLGADGANPSIINILDQRVLHPNPQFFSYTLTKTALATATTTMAQALAPRIRVNAIAPGPTLPSVHQSETVFAAEVAAVPLQRPSAPEDIAAAALYLASARAVTGQIIAVDAGQHLAWRTPDIDASGGGQ